MESVEMRDGLESAGQVWWDGSQWYRLGESLEMR
jgi:hypothetical protein